jgi:hypothetical protein
MVPMPRQETSSPPPAPPAGRRWTGLTLALSALVLVFYFWTASSTDDPFILRGPKHDYYNLLTTGFLSGHLYLAAKPDPGLSSPDPAVRAAAPALLDASLYHGHYYLYFGLTPLLLVFLPWRLLTGVGIPENLAAALLAAAGFLLAVALLARIRRRWFPAAGPVLWAAVVLAAGSCTLVPEALRHAMFYEVAITSAFAFAMLFFYASLRALEAPERARPWLAVAGAACVLAIGSRANLAFSILFLPVLVGLVWRRLPPATRDLRRLAPTGLAAAVPAAVGLAGLGLYNALRFGNPLVFGHRYQVGSNPHGFPFALPFLWHNLRTYFFSLPSFSPYFPFFSPGLEGARPAGYWGIEHAHAQFFSAAFGALLLVAVIAAARRGGPAARLGGLLGLLGGWFLLNGLVVCLTGVRADRYLVDFQPALILGAAIGALALASRSGWPGRLARGATVAVLLFGSFYNVMASLQLHEFFRLSNPLAYRRVARLFDYPAWWWERVAGDTSGPLRLAVVFPAQPRQEVEPLVATGTPWFSDTVYVHYFAPDRVNFGFDHTQYRNDAGAPVAIVPGRAYRLEVTMGSLYPPEESPYYDGLTLAQIHELKRTVRIKLDGAVVFAVTGDCFDASPTQVHLGTNPLWPSAESGRFSGTLRLTGRPAPDLAALREAARTETGPIAFEVEFPAHQTGYADPLVATGVNRRADILFVRYVDDGHVQFGLDHWNGPQLLSPLVPVDFGRPHELGVYMGSLYPPAGAVPPNLRRLLMIRLDGRMVWATRAVFHPADPLTVDVGRNVVGASTCRVSFKGNLFDVHHLKLPGSPAPPTGRQAPQLLSICLPDAPDGQTELLFKTVDAAGQPLRGQIRYRDRHSVELGLTAGAKTAWSPPLPADYTRIHDILVGLPFADAPGPTAAGGLTDYLRQRWSTGIHVYFDGRLALADESVRPASAATAWQWPDDILAAGSDAGEAIAGLLSRTNTDAPLAPAPSAWNARGGTVHLELRLPRSRIGYSDPLLTTGRTGAGDALFLHYVDPGHVQFGLDHWGSYADTSPVVAVDYDRPVALVVDWDSAHGRLAVGMNGSEVWRTPARFYPSEGPVRLAVNLLGFSTCYPCFAGEVVSARIDAAPAGPP